MDGKPRPELNDLDFPTKRKILRLLVKRIEVRDEEVQIVYKIQSHPFAVGSNGPTGAIYNIH